MMMSGPAYGRYAEEVLGPQLDPKVLAEIKELEAKEDFENPRYMELMKSHYYTKHLIRMPVDQWPEPIHRMFNHLNEDIYMKMNGPSEFGVRGTLEKWDRTSDLLKIEVPTLVIGATYDTMDPKHMKWVSNQVQQGKFLLCPNGSHLAQYDDQETFFEGLVQFINDVDQGTFSPK